VSRAMKTNRLVPEAIRWFNYSPGRTYRRKRARSGGRGATNGTVWSDTAKQAASAGHAEPPRSYQ